MKKSVIRIVTVLLLAVMPVLSHTTWLAQAPAIPAVQTVEATHIPAEETQEAPEAPEAAPPALVETEPLTTEILDGNVPQSEGPALSGIPPAGVYNGQVIGKVLVPAVGLTDVLTVGTTLGGAQDVLEDNAALIHYDFMGLPNVAPVSVVGGHNYMVFNKLKDAKAGDSVILELNWAVYEYEIYEIKVQPELKSAPRGNLVLYTCHPFDQRENPPENAYFMCRPKGY